MRDKEQLFGLLDDAIEQGMTFCSARDIDVAAILANPRVFKNIGLFNVYADILLSNDEWRRTFNVYENTITSLYEACKPEVLERGAGRTVVTPLRRSTPRTLSVHLLKRRQ